MRTSVAALALFRRAAPAGRVEYLAQWNEGWHAFHFVGGHKRDNESFRDCCVREVSEELGLAEGHGFRVAPERRYHLRYVHWSERAQTDTAYTVELFDAELLSPAVESVEADANNRWLTENDIRAGRCGDGKTVSATMLRILSLAGLTARECDGASRLPAGDSALMPSANTNCPLVLWTLAAHRHLRQALAEAVGRRGPNAFTTAMNDLTCRLHRLFPDARTVIVQDQYLGFRRHDDEFILLVEIDDDRRPGRHVVKLAAPERLAAELSAWQSCRPHGLRHDLVFMPLDSVDDNGQLVGLIYGDAQQFLGDVPAVYLETAFLGAVRHGNPSPAAVADTLVQLYERIGHLLYRTHYVDDPAKSTFVLQLPRLESSFAAWLPLGGEPTRARQDVNSSAVSKRGWFRDPIDYLRTFVCRCVPWMGDIPEGGGPPSTHHPARQHDTPAAEEMVPRMLRGCSHGDLHGRNVLVAIVRERARWPAVFDYEHMAPYNLLAWDFVKMETELKIRAYAALFAGQPAVRFIRAVQNFEVELARRTEACHDGKPWPEVNDKAPPLERLRALLLTLRRQAALHLGIDAGRSREWLDEYYFALTAYGLQAGRFHNLGRPELLGAYVSAGVACARFLWTREERLTLTTDVLRRPYPSYHKPLETARGWLRDGQNQANALELLTELRKIYPHVLTIGNELILALLENKKHGEAIAELGRLERQFQDVDEETRCRWGSLYKREGDRAWKEDDLVAAESRFLQALKEYQRGYSVRSGHYPGINRATLLLYLAALARQRQDIGGSLDYLRQAEEAADDLLVHRARWSKDFADDNVWHPATAGEANLLKRHWSEAAHQYGAALGAANVRPFHRQSIGKQARRILEALALLDVRPEPPFDDPDAFFGPLA